MLKKIVCLGLLLIMCLELAACVNDKEAFARENIKNLTEIEIPIEATILFHYFEGDDMVIPVPGRRSQYTVFEFKDKPTAFLDEYTFNLSRNIENEENFNTDLGFISSTYQEIPSEYLVDWEKDYFWISISRVYFIYYPNELMLVIYVAGS